MNFLVKNNELREKITEFMAGGIFAFAVFSVTSALIFAVSADSPSGFFSALTAASAKLSLADTQESSQDDASDASDADLPDIPTVPQGEDSDFSKLSDKLMGLIQPQSWGIEEAPEETEEPRTKTRSTPASCHIPPNLTAMAVR